MPTKLPWKVDALDEIDEKFHDAYLENDEGNGFTLELDGVDIPALEKAIGKERDNAKKAQRLRREIEQKVGDLLPDIVQVREVWGKREEIMAAELDKDGKREEMLKRHEEKVTRTLRTDIENGATRIKELEATNADLGIAVKRNGIGAELRKRQEKFGIKPSAVETDALETGIRELDMRDERVVVLDRDGEPRMSARSLSTPMNIDEWLTEKADSHSHWFGESSGAGTRTTRARTGSRHIDGADIDALSASQEDIAAGKARVLPST